MAWPGLKKAIASDPAGVAAVMATRIAATPDREAVEPSVRAELASIIEKESVWNPAATNPDTHATGLIQFMPSTAKTLGTTVDELRGMTRTQQAPYVQKFFDKTTNGGKRKLRVPGDLYLLTFSPANLGDADDSVIYAPGSTAWKQNPSLRDGKEGPITAGSVRRAGTPTSPLPPIPSGNSAPGEKPTPAGTTGGWGGAVLLLVALYALSRGR